MAEVKWKGQIVMARAEQAAMLAVHAGAIVLQTAVKGNLGKGGSSNRGNEGKRIGGKDLAVGTGNLRRSIQIGTIENTGATVRTRVGTNSKYARIHEFGGVISAKGKALTIPVHKKAKAASARGQKPRDAFPDSFILKTKTGAMIVRDPTRGKKKITSVGKGGKGRGPTIGPMRKPTIGKRGGASLSHALVKIGNDWKNLEVLYLLVRSVRIPPRPYFRPAVAEASAIARDKVRSIFKKHMSSR